MKESLNKLCEDFAVNREVVRKAYKMESSYIYPICANIFCAKGMVIQPDRLAESKRMLKEKTGVLSNFRGIIQAPVACMLATETGGESRMERALVNYKLLKKKFWGSEYLALVAFLMTDLVSEARAPEKIERGRTIYERMKKEHPLLTSGEDSIFAVLMAFSDQSDDALLEDMETCYALLKKKFFSGNAVQSASHVLAMTPGRPEDKVARMTALYDALKQSGRKYGRHYELSTLAAVASLDVPLEQLTEEILEVDQALANQKGYGLIGIGRQMRLMHAAMLVSDLYMPNGQVDTAALAGTVALIAAQQAAMCAVIASSAATSAASSSH